MRTTTTMITLLSKFDDMKNAISEFLDKPIAIIGMSVGSLLLLILTILAKTSIGRKKLIALKNEFGVVKSSVSNFNDKTKNEILLLEEKIKGYENELQAKEDEIKRLEELVLNIAQNINNRQIKSLTGEYKQEKDNN